MKSGAKNLMIKFLVSDSTGNHLPYTDESGSPDHRLMGAAWAVLHEGYRGNKYEGPGKTEAITRLKALYKSEKMDTPVESDGTLCGFVCNLEESASDGVYKIRIIQPGFNKSGTRYYPADMLKSDFHVFEGAKMFSNHQTSRQEKERPEGDLTDWVGMLKNVKPDASGALFGEAVAIDPRFKEKLDTLKKHGLLGEMGVSIRAAGIGSKRTVDGKQTNYIESLTKARSVDFVTYAGAGGRVEAMESEQDFGEYQISSPKKENTMTEAEIAKLQADLAAANAKVTASETEATSLKAKIAEAETTTAKSVTAIELEKQLKESKLPEASQDRLRGQFKDAVKVDGIKEAIASEKEYVTKLTGKKVVNLGEKDNRGTNDGKSENDLAKLSTSVFGLSEAEAKIFADRL
jgi:hypothetical protein